MFDRFNRKSTENTRTYMASSVFSDPIALIALVMIIADTESFKRRVPDSVEGWINDLVGWAILIIRFLFTERPVAIIPPFDAKPVEVKKIDPKEGR